MTENLNFRRIKILLKKEGNLLDKDYFEKLLEEDIQIDDKWFLKGCRHITERHYTEAIKYFQLSSHIDAKFMALVSAFKVADKFLFEEYLSIIDNLDKTKFSELFNRYGIEPYLSIENQELHLNLETINLLKQIFS